MCGRRGVDGRTGGRPRGDGRAGGCPWGRSGQWPSVRVVFTAEPPGGGAPAFVQRVERAKRTDVMGTWSFPAQTPLALSGDRTDSVRARRRTVVLVAR